MDGLIDGKESSVRNEGLVERSFAELTFRDAFEAAALFDEWVVG